MTRVYKKGTIKVVWITDGKNIFSKMFDDLDFARKFAEGKKDYLIFKLFSRKEMEEFTWELLPYGRSGIYRKLLRIYKQGLLSKIISKW